MQSGANQIVEKYERECLEDSPDECNDLGVAAAQGEANMLYWSCNNIVNLQSSYYLFLKYPRNHPEIAFEYCPFPASFAPEDSIRPDYKQKCREVAYGICEGAISDQIEDNGCSITTTELEELQEKCEGQVDMMTGGPSIRDTDMPTYEPTPRPTKKPSRRPTKRYVGSSFIPVINWFLR